MRNCCPYSIIFDYLLYLQVEFILDKKLLIMQLSNNLLQYKRSINAFETLGFDPRGEICEKDCWSSITRIAKKIFNEVNRFALV